MSPRLEAPWKHSLDRRLQYELCSRGDKDDGLNRFSCDVTTDASYGHDGFCCAECSCRFVAGCFEGLEEALRWLRLFFKSEGTRLGIITVCRLKG